MPRKANFDVVLDCADPARLGQFWSEALGYKTLVSWADGAVLVPETEVRPPLILQRVPESKNGKNRMHIDIVTEDVESEVARIEVLGAKRLHEGLREFGGSRWITMADPEGNEFCVCTGVEW
jgi:predicted enzyme related to lactoylglutathione lyase